MANTTIRRAIASCALCLATLATGCTATLTTTPVRSRVLYDYPVVYVDAAPARLYDSPRAYYHGQPAYYVGSRWYYPVDGGWVYFAQEPRELRTQRLRRSDDVAPREARRGYVEPRRRYAEPRRRVERPTERRRRYD